MPQYFFAIRTDDGDAPEPRTELKDDAGALAFACELVRELMKAGLASTYPGSLVTVRDETRAMVLPIPFLAACA